MTLSNFRYRRGEPQFKKANKNSPKRNGGQRGKGGPSKEKNERGKEHTMRKEKNQTIPTAHPPSFWGFEQKIT